MRQPGNGVEAGVMGGGRRVMCVAREEVRGGMVRRLRRGVCGLAGGCILFGLRGATVDWLRGGVGDGMRARGKSIPSGEVSVRLFMTRVSISLLLWLLGRFGAVVAVLEDRIQELSGRWPSSSSGVSSTGKSRPIPAVSLGRLSIASKAGSCVLCRGRMRVW